MMIHEPSRSVILKLRDPSKVTDVVPKSRVVDHNGVALTQVHHGIDETKVLNNLGFNVPSPILYHYEWRGKFKPFPHQAETSAFFTMHKRCICLNDMGTGKSLSALWSADYLMDVGKVRKAIIFSPLSTIESVWKNEINTHFMFNRTVNVLHGSKQKRLERLADTSADFYVINHDGLRVPEIVEAISKRQDIDLWILDEAAAYRNAQSNRYKQMAKLVPSNVWLWLMTGTPCPTQPTDAWALARLLGNPNAPKYFSGFKQQTMNQVTQYKWVAKPDAYQKVYEILKPGIRFRKQDVLKDLPPVTYQLRKAEMTKDQVKHYKQMQQLLVTQVGQAGQEVTAANAAVKMLKLLQVTSGALYDEHGIGHTIDASKRLKVLEELVEASSAKVIVFVPFTAVLEQVRAHLAKRWSVAVVDGNVSSTQRGTIFTDFQNQPDPHILLAHPDTASHGLTLTAADHTIWYAPIFNLETFQQACNRMDRPGQQFAMTISMIACNKLEHELYRALYQKQRMQDSVLGLYKRELGLAA